jgi:hypothetical protein
MRTALRESQLHATLKTWYAQPGDVTEVPVNGFLIDLKRGDTLIEIQTRNFSAKRKRFSVAVGAEAGGAKVGRLWRDLAECAGYSLWLSRQVTYCLRGMGALEIVGQQGRAWLYARPRNAGR